MRYTVLMILGLLIGARLLPKKYLHLNTKIQVAVTIALLFTMGIAFGVQPNFLSDLRTVGLISLLYAVGGIIFSAGIVWLLAKLFLKEEKR